MVTMNVEVQRIEKSLKGGLLGIWLGFFYVEWKDYSLIYAKSCCHGYFLFFNKSNDDPIHMFFPFLEWSANLKKKKYNFRNEIQIFYRFWNETEVW